VQAEASVEVIGSCDSSSYDLVQGREERRQLSHELDIPNESKRFMK
jgi:hypothetical protein